MRYHLTAMTTSRQPSRSTRAEACYWTKRAGRYSIVRNGSSEPMAKSSFTRTIGSAIKNPEHLDINRHMSTSARTAMRETGRCQDARSTITTIQALAESVENPQELIGLYGGVPSLDTVKIRSIHLSRLGPMVKLRIDLPTYPEAPPAEWKEFHCDTVQCQVEFINVSNFRLRNSALPTVADITFSIVDGAAKVGIEGPGLSATFDCLPFTLVGHIGAFKASDEGSDSGKHFYVRKIDAKLFDSTPSLHQRAFYDNI